MTIEIRSWVDPASWDDYVRNHAGGTLYHSTKWLAVAETFGAQTRTLGLWKNNQLVGALPLVTRKMGPLVLAGSPLNGISTPHMGPILDDPQLMGEFLLGLEAYAKSEGIDYLELAFSSEVSEELLTQAGYTVETRQTLTMNIPPDEDALWQGMEVRCRNATRKSEKSGVQIEFCNTLESWLNDYMEMSQALYERQGTTSPFSETYFRTLWEKLYPEQLNVLVARFEGKAIAAALFPRFKNACYYVDGVSLKEYNKLNPNNLVQWRFLQWATASGVTFYDMVGANIPSIAKFKVSFGSQYHSYTYAYRSLNLKTRLARQAYSKYGSALKRLVSRS